MSAFHRFEDDRHECNTHVSLTSLQGFLNWVQQGRAYLEARIKLKEKRYNNVEGGIMKIVVDGYNAPVTAGAFVDLVEKKFYDGMEVQRSDGLVVQTGRPEGDVSHCS